jgi:hypothetical protein
LRFRISSGFEVEKRSSGRLKRRVMPIKKLAVFLGALSLYSLASVGIAASSDPVAAPAVIAGGFDTPEDAVRALERAYVQKNADAAVTAIDFVEEGRQMLQKINPTLANDAEIIKQAAQDLELSFRNDLRTKGFPDVGKLKCSFVGKAQISPGLVKLTEECLFPDGGKSVQDLIVTKRDLGWRVTLPPPP